MFLSVLVSHLQTTNCGGGDLKEPKEGTSGVFFTVHFRFFYCIYQVSDCGVVYIIYKTLLDR